VKNVTRALFVVVLAVSGYGASCDHVVGPDLSAEIESQSLIPTATVEEADPFEPSNICCCRVIGSVRNTSSIPVNVSLRFNATNLDGGAVGQAVAYVENIPVGGSKPYEAPGIFSACSRIGAVVPSEFVIGIFDPNAN
jgi:hypothetical protein